MIKIHFVKTTLNSNIVIRHIFNLDDHICFIEIVDESNHFSVENGRVTLEIDNKTKCHVMIKETKLKDSGTWGITIRTGQKGSVISKNYKHILTVGVVGRFRIIERCTLI